MEDERRASGSLTDEGIPGVDDRRMSAPESEDRRLLMCLHAECGGSSWRNQEGWGTDAPLGEWHGVIEKDGRVVELNLRDNSLKGRYAGVAAESIEGWGGGAFGRHKLPCFLSAMMTGMGMGGAVSVGSYSTVPTCLPSRRPRPV